MKQVYTPRPHKFFYRNISHYQDFTDNNLTVFVHKNLNYLVRRNYKRHVRFADMGKGGEGLAPRMKYWADMPF